MSSAHFARPAAGPLPAFDRFWRTVFAPIRVEPAIARLEPSRFGPNPPLRAA